MRKRIFIQEKDTYIYICINIHLYKFKSKELPEPAGKVDQVPRTCTAGLRKKLKQETTKMGSRGSDTSPHRDAV